VLVVDETRSEWHHKREKRSGILQTMCAQRGDGHRRILPNDRSQNPSLSPRLNVQVVCCECCIVLTQSNCLLQSLPLCVVRVTRSRFCSVCLLMLSAGVRCRRFRRPVLRIRICRWCSSALCRRVQIAVPTSPLVSPRAPPQQR
jgi:hypothetical protein